MPINKVLNNHVWKSPAVQALQNDTESFFIFLRAKFDAIKRCRDLATNAVHDQTCK